MSEVSPPVQPAALVNHRPQVEDFLGQMLKLMKYPAHLDFKDMPDGALGVAVHFEGELPGIQGNKRSYLIDCMQFLVNKVINRPNVPRRWVNLGANQFPEPKTQPGAVKAAPSAPLAGNGKVAAPLAPAPAPSAPVAGKVGNKSPKGAPPDARQKTPDRGSRSVQPDERSLEVKPDPVWSKLGQSLSEKAVRLGRVYAVMMVSPENRARLLAQSAKGLTVKAEGEGHWRRVAFVPEKITPIARKQVMPDYDDDEGDDE